MTLLVPEASNMFVFPPRIAPKVCVAFTRLEAPPPITDREAPDFKMFSNPPQITP